MSSIPIDLSSPSVDDFVDRLVRSLPVNHVDRSDSGNLDFLQRLLRPSGEGLQFVWQTYNAIASYVTPASANETWIDWILQEWFDWTLYPDSWAALPSDFVLKAKRRLLSHFFGGVELTDLALTAEVNPVFGSQPGHYSARGTIPGIRNLLLEFGVHAIVTDGPMFVGGFLGKNFPGSRYPATVGARPIPLGVRVIVQYVEPCQVPIRTFVGGFIGSVANPSGGMRLFKAIPYVTPEFVVNLCAWQRAAGTRFTIEFRTASYQKAQATTILG